MNTELSDKDAEIVCDIVGEECNVPRIQVSLESNIREDFSPDSLTMIELSMRIEERFDVSIPDEAVERIVTVRDLCEVLADVQGQARR